MSDIPTQKNKNKVGSTLTVVNQVKLDPKLPIPLQYGSNDIKYSPKGKKYIPFLDQKDNLATQLIEARISSSTQNSCVSTIVQSTVGKGLMILDNENPDKDFISFLTNINSDEDTIDDIISETLDGERTTGNHFVVIAKGDLAGSKFIKVYSHSIREVRLGAINEKGVPTSIIISKEFGRTAKAMSKNLPENNIEIPLYNHLALKKEDNWKDMGDGTYRTAIHFKNKYPGIDYYGLPRSIASIRYQVLEGEYAQYNLDNLENNMVLGGMLMFKSAMTQEEANANAKNILLSHVGAGKTGRIAVVSSEQGLGDVEFKAYDTQKEGSFLETDKRCEDKIIASNDWAKEFCTSDTSTLGKGGDYIRSLWDLKETTLLKPLRRRVISKVVKQIARIYAEHTGKKEVQDYKFELTSDMPYSMSSDIKPEDVMQVNEARELLKLGIDDTKKGIYISELKAKTKKDVPA